MPEEYYVEVPEVHYSILKIEADSPEEALAKARDAEGEEIALEYSHVLENEMWTVKNADGKEVIKG
jgi:hypothetical protein